MIIALFLSFDGHLPCVFPFNKLKRYHFKLTWPFAEDSAITTMYGTNDKKCLLGHRVFVVNHSLVGVRLANNTPALKWPPKCGRSFINQYRADNFRATNAGGWWEESVDDLQKRLFSVESNLCQSLSVAVSWWLVASRDLAFSFIPTLPHIQWNRCMPVTLVGGWRADSWSLDLHGDYRLGDPRNQSVHKKGPRKFLKYNFVLGAKGRHVEPNQSWQWMADLATLPVLMK